MFVFDLKNGAVEPIPRAPSWKESGNTRDPAFHGNPAHPHSKKKYLSESKTWGLQLCPLSTLIMATFTSVFLSLKAVNSLTQLLTCFVNFPRV